MSPILFRTVRLWLHIVLIFSLLQSAVLPLAASSAPVANADNEQIAESAGFERPTLVRMRDWLAANLRQEDSRESAGERGSSAEDGMLYLPQLASSERLRVNDILTSTPEIVATPDVTGRQLFGEQLKYIFGGRFITGSTVGNVPTPNQESVSDCGFLNCPVKVVKDWWQEENSE